MKKREFMRRTGLSEGVAQRVASGRPISRGNVAAALKGLQRRTKPRSCELDGCDRPVPDVRSRFCFKAHRDRSYRARKKGPADLGPTCGGCGAVLMGTSFAGPCPVCSRQNQQ